MAEESLLPHKPHASVAGIRAAQVELVNLPRESVAFALLRFGTPLKSSILDLENVLRTIKETVPQSPPLLVCFSDTPIEVQDIYEKSLHELGWVRAPFPPYRMELRPGLDFTPETAQELRARLAEGDSRSAWQIIHLALAGTDAATEAEATTLSPADEVHLLQMGWLCEEKRAPRSWSHPTLPNFWWSGVEAAQIQKHADEQCESAKLPSNNESSPA